VKRYWSTKTKLIVPTSIVFSGFIIAMILSAYTLYFNSVTNQATTQMDATSNQVLKNYESYFDSVVSVSDSILSTYNSTDETNKKDTISTYFDTIKSVKTEILDMSLYKASDGSIISSDSGSSPSNVGTSTDWFIKATSNKLISNFTLDSSASEGEHRFVFSRFASYDKDESYDAVLKVEYDFSRIVDTVSQVSLGEAGRFTIFDKNYNIVYSSNSNAINEEISLIKELVIGTSNISLDGHNFHLYAATISNTTWRVAILMNTDSMAATISQFAWIISDIGVGLIIIFMVVLIIIANSITNPIRRLQKEMAEIESLNYDGSLQSEVEGTKEVVELNKSFNSMMGRIKELMQSIVEEKEEQRKSELKALQNQINPHFLYNTLDSVIALIDKGENEQAEKMIVALSKFFRISISKGHNVIPLTNEIEHAKYYLLIQKMRFGDTFSYDISVEPGLENYYVVKLILQPIVENSIGHGLKEGEEGHINIKAYIQDKFIRFDVSDDGYGMTPSKVEELQKSLIDNTVYKGVGLKNVFQRLRIYYGNEANVLIHSEEDVGTTISILIPKKKAVNDEK
jgi:two-component system sensor histidine kinase YesM